jgi:hypothetical protein
VRLEGLGQLKKSDDPIGNRIRDLPACSIVPQPTTLPLAPRLTIVLSYILYVASNDSMTVNDERERMWKEGIMAWCLPDQNSETSYHSFCLHSRTRDSVMISGEEIADIYTLKGQFGGNFKSVGLSTCAV